MNHALTDASAVAGVKVVVDGVFTHLDFCLASLASLTCSSVAGAVDVDASTTAAIASSSALVTDSESESSSSALTLCRNAQAQQLMASLEWLNTPVSLRLRTVIFTPNAPVSKRWKVLVVSVFRSAPLPFQP